MKNWTSILCKHSIFVIMIIVLGGLLCWSKRVACMVL